MPVVSSGKSVIFLNDAAFTMPRDSFGFPRYTAVTVIPEAAGVRRLEFANAVTVSASQEKRQE